MRHSKENRSVIISSSSSSWTVRATNGSSEQPLLRLNAALQTPWFLLNMFSCTRAGHEPGHGLWSPLGHGLVGRKMNCAISSSVCPTGADYSFISLVRQALRLILLVLPVSLHHHLSFLLINSMTDNYFKHWSLISASSSFLTLDKWFHSSGWCFVSVCVA